MMDKTNFFLNKWSHTSLVIFIRLLQSDLGRDWESEIFLGEILLSIIKLSAGKALAVGRHNPETSPSLGKFSKLICFFDSIDLK